MIHDSLSFYHSHVTYYARYFKSRPSVAIDHLDNQARPFHSMPSRFHVNHGTAEAHSCAISWQAITCNNSNLEDQARTSTMLQATKKRHEAMIRQTLNPLADYEVL